MPSGYIEDGESPYNAKKIISLGYYTLDYTMFEQKGNVFVAYDLVNDNTDGKSKQALGRMEKIEADIITVDKIMRLLNKNNTLSYTIQGCHSLNKCARCGIETYAMSYYSCEHTNEEKMCTYCYQEIHWDLTK